MARVKLSQHSSVAVKELAHADFTTVLLGPPAWTRLEPQTLSGDPAPGTEMRIADPIWMLARQWQLGEFRGEDCGSPVSVRISATTLPITALRYGDPGRRASAEQLVPGQIFEPRIEAEPWAPPTLRDRAEAARALIASLAPLGWGGEAQLLNDCPFDLGAVDIGAQRPDATWQLIARHLPDAELAASQMEAGNPAWLSGEPANVTQAAAQWLDWYRRNVSVEKVRPDSWHAERLEYRFAIQAGEGAEARSLEAPCHLGGPVDWYSFDMSRNRGLGAIGTPKPQLQQHDTHVHATRLRYVGMPAPRLWQMEDGLVNFGLTDVQPNDLTRVAFLEYATIYGTDWLVAPIDLPRAALAQVTGVSYLTSFGEAFDVKCAGDGNRKGRFALYHMHGADNDTGDAFLIPPNSRTALDGEPREEVIFARDESANVVWAIERSIEGADGLAHDRSSEEPSGGIATRPVARADDAWTLEVLPPDYWIPMIPVPLRGMKGGFELRKGSFDGTDRAAGRILSPVPFVLKDEEVPREGIRLRRVTSVLRDEDGTLHRWTARQIGPAWGQESSRLEYDVTCGQE